MARPDLIETLAAALAEQGSPSSDFDLNPSVVLPEGRVLRPAAVLVPIVFGPKGAEVILTKRSARLKHHPGQIAFPGGKQDAIDPTPEAAALREAHEEIGLPTDLINVLGTLPCHETVTGFQVTPVVAWVRDAFAEVPEVGEVAEIFRVPLDHVLTPANYVIEHRIWRGEPRRFFAVPYGPYYIWGATARMLRGLADRVGS